MDFCIECGSKCCSTKDFFVIALKHERDLIVKKTGTDPFKKLGNLFYCLEPCPFLLDGKCSINEIKPIDCKIFPVIPSKKGDKIIYEVDLDCPAAEKLPESFLQEVLELGKEYIKQFSKEDLQVMHKKFGDILKKRKYAKIAEIKTGP